MCFRLANVFLFLEEEFGHCEKEGNEACAPGTCVEKSYGFRCNCSGTGFLEEIDFDGYYGYCNGKNVLIKTRVFQFCV